MLSAVNKRVNEERIIKQPPLAHLGWSSVWDATDWREVCPQLDYRGRPIGSEDCLFLNVFTPGIKKGNTFPVVVFVHGGNFDSGSGNLFGPQALVDQNLVVVTLNYRLGMLGFASTEDDALPGNLGLRDQLLALQWVRDNIAVFGGQPDRVTLQGQGSGAVCVLLHVVSPQSKGLFHRAMVQSGTPLSEGSLHMSVREATQSAALSLGCSSVISSHDVRDCLYNIPVHELLRTQQEGKILGDYPLKFTPRIDPDSHEPMLPTSPTALLASGNFAKVPIIIGYNRDETAVLYPELLALLRSELGDDQDYVRNILLPKFFRTALNIRDFSKETLDDVYENYFSGTNYKDHDGIIQAFVNMSTSALFVVPILETVVLLARSSPSTFVYSFSYRGDISMLDSKLGQSASRRVNLGPAHGDELLYLFQVIGSGLRPSTNLVDEMVSRRMIKMWSDFSRVGAPVPSPDREYLPWSPSSPSNITIYQLGRSLRPHFIEPQEADTVALWRSVLPQMTDNTKQVEQVALSGHTSVDPVYRTLAYSMLTVALALLVAVTVLLAILYRQTRSNSFMCGGATPETNSRSSPDNTYDIY
ncbi:liver carboxylesterase 2-like isoform X2 [Varroa destructor]|uniref:Carboxylesterase type B domain-containing protein n=1 Tax=Varroa destructor TaxID=109461 RepID=A0A7M7KC24_VARDE|nr:liver carboxylesterase 2-like isoform X2 [Varroa destructor]XP_022663581.1 liver carboxylesterase 2-like isoform X2 [Varroa destructor]